MTKVQNHTNLAENGNWRKGKNFISSPVGRMMMREHSLAPKKADHSWVNLYRSPYKRRFTAFFYRMKGPFTDFQKDADLLFDTFLENYNDYVAGKMPDSLEQEYKNFGIPGPLQYKAFNKLVTYFRYDEFEFLKHKHFYHYNTTLENTNFERGIIEFVGNLFNYDFNGQDKKLVLCCGSFWEKCPAIREKMLVLFERLYREKGIKIHIYTNCKKEEISEHKEFLEQISGTSCFGLETRIPIHFIQAGNDYFFIEFPHAEEIHVRLNLFMDLNTIKYKKNFHKADVELFFENLIQQALD